MGEAVNRAARKSWAVRPGVGLGRAVLRVLMGEQGDVHQPPRHTGKSLMGPDLKFRDTNYNIAYFQQY